MRKSEEGEGEKGGGNTEGSDKNTKFKGTSSKARNPWAMTVSFQSGNRGGEFVCLYNKHEALSS